jgi:hypothetical protein
LAFARKGLERRYRSGFLYGIDILQDHYGTAVLIARRVVLRSGTEKDARVEQVLKIGDVLFAYFIRRDFELR